MPNVDGCFILVGVSVGTSPEQYWYADDPADVFARYRVFLFDRGRAAAERQGGGSGRRVRRDGIADHVRAARVGDGAVEGDHCRGGDLHDHVDVAVDSGDAAFRDCIERSGFGEESETSCDEAAGAEGSAADA